MTKIELTVNGHKVSKEVEDRTLLVTFIREELDLTGTHVGCDTSQCGCCTVHMDGVAVKSCTVLAAQASGAEITTIEGLSNDRSHPVQRAWIEIDVPQCGYCQSGQIMAAAALLEEDADPSDDVIRETMTNICRCGTYNRILKAIKLAAEYKSEAT